MTNAPNSPEPAGSPDSLESLAAIRPKGSKAKVLGVAAVLVVGVVATLMVADRRARAKSEHAIAEQFSSLETCLVGKLEGGETASSRLRAIQLGQLALADGDRGGNDAWPTRCYVPADALRTALQNEPGASKDETPFARAVRELADVLRTSPDAVSRDLSPWVDKVWQGAEQRKIQRISTSQTVAPEPVRAPSLVAWRGNVLQSTPFTLANLFLDPDPSGVRWGLVDDPSFPQKLLCSFSDREAKCAPLASGVPLDAPPYRLLATVDGATSPLLFTGRRGLDGIYRTKDGSKVGATYAYSGVVRDDGFAAVLGWNESTRKPELLRQKPAGETIVTEPKYTGNTGNFFYSTALLWDWVIYRTAQDDEIRLFAARVRVPDGGAKDAGLDDPIEIGALAESGQIEGNEETPHITGCRAGDSTFVRIKEWDSDEMVVSSKGDAWSKPMHVGSHGGVFTCVPGAATVTWAFAGGSASSPSIEVQQSRCTSASCTPSFTTVKLQEAAAPRDGRVEAFDVAGKVLLVWAAGDRGGVRMRFAPPSNLADAPDRVLVDDLGNDGKSVLYDVRAIPVEGGAVVVLSTKLGVFTLRVGADGASS